MIREHKTFFLDNGQRSILLLQGLTLSYYRKLRLFLMWDLGPRDALGDIMLTTLPLKFEHRP